MMIKKIRNFRLGRITLTGLIAVAILTLCACGGGEKTAESTSPSTDVVSTTAVQTSTPGQSPTPEQSPIPEQSAAPEQSAIPEQSSAPEQSAIPEQSSTASESAAPQSDNPPEQNNPQIQPPPTAPNDFPEHVVLPESGDMGQDYIDSIIFLGDSTTYGLRYYEVLSGGEDTMQVWTPSSGTLTLSNQSFVEIVYPRTNSEITIRDAVEYELPELMVITLGVNGVSFMDKDFFKSEYSALVNDIIAISPGTKIILQSIFPIASNYEYQGDINNTVISEANNWIMEIAEECGVRYLNTISVLLGSDGFLPQSYQNGDGIHLNETGFGVVLNYIRTHGYA